MPELPTGTVTMLFSDIEGSTALLSRLGQRYAETLSAQRALLRAAFTGEGGREMGTEGDSFFVVFASAGAAVRSAIAAQHALATHAWPDGVPVRVRMGLHSGEPERHDDGYVGMDVHRAARIAAAAHGGQVVLSDPTRLLAEPALPPGAALRDLGWHRLKDLTEPEHLYQLEVPGLPAEFPPLKSLGAQTSLPVPATALVGRDTDLEQLTAMILRPGIRLVTLTGTGGVGKTRLALAAAAALEQSFPGGVYFVPLAPVSNGDVMWKVIADRLGVSGDRPAAEAVLAHLRTGRCLLVLDNLEQLAEGGAVVAELLAATTGLVVLATSRRPLHVAGEQERPVLPLAVPAEADAAADEVASFSAVRLFAQQAALVRPDFAVTPANAADVAAVCRRLDGLPLAIELAAARVKLLAPRAILARLRQSLSLAAADAGRPSRQQTLRNTIAWSYDLLGPAAQRVYRQAGVFEGGCDLDAFAAVALAGEGADAAADPLQWASELLDASLITVTEDPEGEPRVQMLETIREYALERLEQSGDMGTACRRHAEYYAALAEQAHGKQESHTSWAWLGRLELEHDNLRAALRWSLEGLPPGPEADERAAIGLRLVRNLARFWYQHGHAKTAQRWLERAVAITSVQAGAPLARAGHWLGVLRQQLGDNAAAAGLFARSLAIWREVGDTAQMALELNSLGITYRGLGDLAKARAFLEESIATARKIAHDARLSTALSNLGIVEIDAGNVQRAMAVLQEALAIDEKRGDTWGATIVKNSLAGATLLAGRADEARHVLASILGDVTASGDLELMASVMEVGAGVAAHLGEPQRAARLVGAAEALRERAAIPPTAYDAALLVRLLAPARATAAPADWDAEVAAGRALTAEKGMDLLTGRGPAVGGAGQA